MIRETARRVDEGEDVVIYSAPVLDFPGGSKFTTSSCLRLSPTPAGCLVRVSRSSNRPTGFLKLSILYMGH